MSQQRTADIGSMRPTGTAGLFNDGMADSASISTLEPAEGDRRKEFIVKINENKQKQQKIRNIENESKTLKNSAKNEKN